jgi:hypothetical protein
MDVIERVKAALAVDAFNGDEMERAVFASQVQELVELAEKLEDTVFHLENPYGP